MKLKTEFSSKDTPEKTCLNKDQIKNRFLVRILMQLLMCGSLIKVRHYAAHISGASCRRGSGPKELSTSQRYEVLD